MAGSTVDILARLKLNGQNFTSELQRELGAAERKFGQTGNVIGRNISQGIGGGLQNAAGQVPVLGSALAGLSGPALIAAGAVGAIGVAAAAGVRDAESLGREIRKLDAVIGAANRTGLSRQQLIDYSEEMEGRLAIAQEEIIKTQTVLATFDGVAGDTFKRVMEASADMSALWEGDLTGNAEKLAVVIQNLSQGSVSGLSKGFKRLGPDTLEAIENLVKLGRESEAIELLLKRLEDRIGNGAEADAKGVSGALFRLKDSVFDVNRGLFAQTGLYSGVEKGLDAISSSVSELADKLKDLNGLKATGTVLTWLIDNTPQGRFVENIIPGGRLMGDVRRFTSGAPKKASPLDPWSGDQWTEWSAQVKAQGDAERAAKGAKTRNERERAEEDAKAGLVRFRDPVDGRISSGFGPRSSPGGIGSRNHRGIDYAVPVGTPVRAPAVGVVESVGYNESLGKYVVINHGAGTRTRYGHLSATLIEKDKPVEAGQVFARSGNSGKKTTGAHLHYQVEQGDQKVDPRIGKFRVSEDSALTEAEQRTERERDTANEKKKRDDADRRQKQDQILATMRDQLNVDIDSLRYADLRARGLDRQAALEEEIDVIQRRAAEHLAGLPDKEAKVTAEVEEQLALFDRQAAAMADLIEANGARATVTKEEVAAEQEASQAMRDALADAYSLVQTGGDRLKIEEAIARAKLAINAAVEDGTKAEEKAKDAEEARLKAAEKWLEEEAGLRKEAFDAHQDQIRDLADFYERAFRSGGKSIWEDFEDEGFRVIASMAAQWTMALLSGQKVSFGSLLQQIGATSNGGQGGFLGSLFGSGGLLNLAKKAPGGGVGGGMGSLIPGAGDMFAAMGGGGGAAAGATGGMWDGMSGAVGGAKAAGGIMGSINSAMPYVAAATAVMSVLGIDPMAEIKKLISGTKRGSATLGLDPSGGLGVGSSRGNSSSRIGAASDGIGSVADTLARIAEALNGSVIGAGSVSLGMRDGKWRGDPTGQGITKTKNGAIDFGDDQEAAIRWAIGEALRDGVIGAISDTQRRILASGQDLEKAIEKAVMVGEIPRRLKAMLDPVGAEMEEFHERWEEQLGVLKEAGATTEELADAHKLYRLELEEVKGATREASAGLKDFLESLNFGSGSPFSLRDQERMASESLQPWLDKIGSGEKIDQAKFQEAARGFLDVERELYGSTGKYFEAMDMIRAATGKAIAEIDNAKPIRTFADPFVEKTASNTTAMTHMLDQLNERAASQGETLNRILSAMGGGNGGFIGGARGFDNRER